MPTPAQRLLRKTFVAPIFPLPCFRMSAPAVKRTIRKPKGIEPEQVTDDRDQ